MPNWDYDGDGDHDQFDQAQHDIYSNPGNSMGQMLEEIDGLETANAFHEFLEDLGELIDGNPDNDSFTDGGNGSGNEPADGEPS